MGVRRPRLPHSAPTEVGEQGPAPAFRIVLSANRGKPALTLPATDASSALILAQRHGKGRKAELWRGDKLVCRIAEDQFAGFWEIG